MPETSDLADDDQNSIASRQKQISHRQGLNSNESQKRQTQPSVSIEQAARPSFDITVGDPHKIGDLTSSHIVYQVRTKVRVDQLHDIALPILWLTDIRLPQKLTSSLSSLSVVDTEISYGFITRCIIATLE